jgi:4-nitrophenyl phosphatase
MNNLATIRNFIIDMDGVLWRGQDALPGLVEFFETLDRCEIKFCLATNNSTRTPQEFVEKLRGMGVMQVAPRDVITSSVATAKYLKRQAAGTRVAPLGEPALTQALADEGFGIDHAQPDYVVVGMDYALTWEKLARATLQIRAGAPWLGTNPDGNIPSERGIVPETGAILAALQAATDVPPTVIGKPEPIMYEMALEQLGGTLENTAAIGDRLDTDILGAHRTGIASILVLTGIATREQAERSMPPPTWVMQGLPEIARAISEHC